MRRGGHADQRIVVGASSVASAGAAHAIDAVDREVGRVDAAQLLGAGMDVHQRLARHRRLEQRVAAGRHLAEARPDREDQVGLADARARASD